MPSATFHTALLLATIAVSACAGVVRAADADFDVKAELEKLRAEVQELRARSDETWLNERRTEEVRSLIREVLDDADTRASLAEGGSTAGHNGKHFFLASEDGSFLMNLSGQLQMRYIWNSRDDSNSDDVDANESGFTIRRAKLRFDGHIADPRLHYVVQLEVSRATNSVFGHIITIGYDLTDTLTVRVGETTAPFLYEEMVSSRRQLTVERSLVNEMFTQDVVQGIFVTWDATEQVRFNAVVHDGGKSGEPTVSRMNVFNVLPDFDGKTGGSYSAPDFSINKDFNRDSTDFAVTGRVDVLLAGSWAQTKDFSSFPGEQMMLRVGAAVTYEENESGQNASGVSIEDDDPIFAWTVDAQFEQEGFNLFASFTMAHTDFEESGATNYAPWGVVVQGGYNFDLGNGDSLEPFVRYEHADWDGAISDLGTGFDDAYDLVTFGFNWYHDKHNAKLTADVVWALDAIEAAMASGSSAVLTDGHGDSDDQIAVRLQYQLLF